MGALSSASLRFYGVLFGDEETAIVRVAPFMTDGEGWFGRSIKTYRPEMGRFIDLSPERAVYQPAEGHLLCHPFGQPIIQVHLNYGKIATDLCINEQHKQFFIQILLIWIQL